MRAAICGLLLGCLVLPWSSAQAQASLDPVDVLNAEQWERSNRSVDRALDWLASQQNLDGSFPTLPTGQPGVTSLCTMAFLAQGHTPGEGRYGETLKSAINYIVSCQKKNGLLSLAAPNSIRISRNISHQVGYTTPYNHALAGLVLCESYAMAGAEVSQEIAPTVERAIAATLSLQQWPKDFERDMGGALYR